MTAKLGAWCGLIGVAGNILGVAVLGPIPSAYRPGTIVSWAREVSAAPEVATVSALAFALGLLALAGWAVITGLRIGTPLATAAGAAIGIGAVLNGAGTLTPLVVVWHLPMACAPVDGCVPVAVALLGISLSLDAFFNLLLGLGLVILGATLWRGHTNARSLAALMIIAGTASIPVSLQVFSDAAARLLIVAGPLWLAAILWSSVLLWRRRL